jgi:osmotically-inducible protein OsmY
MEEVAMYRLISFVKGAAIGAGMMYFFDPVSGNRRRALLRDQFIHLANKGCDVADAKYRDMQNRLYGTFAEMRSSLRHDEPTDDVLCDRVRSAIGRYITHPGAIEVHARNGVVTLSGPVLSREVNDLLCAVNSVRGVRSIEDRLDVRPMAGNTSALQGAGSRPS